MNHSPQPPNNQSNKTAIASPQSALIWSGLLVGTFLTIAAPTVSSTPYQAKVTGWDSSPAERYMAQPMTDSMLGSMPHSMPDSMPNSMTDPTTDPDTSFQPIDQPLGVKALVTIGGLALMAGELWWFLGNRVRSDG
ncbi:MAG: hypothetical protein ACTS2F_21075 [Thainema sp.]